MTPTAIMREIRNCFPGEFRTGDFVIEGGALKLDGTLPDFAVLYGSTQDGLHDLRQPFQRDESFTGCVLFCNPPADFLALCEDIDAWCKAHPDPTLRSESFGAYSRTMVDSADWPAVFATRLRPYRRMFPEVKL